jgi:hypothetical protein
MRLEDRQIDIRQDRSVLEIIQARIKTAGQIMADITHKHLYQIAVRGRQPGANNGMCRGFSALCDAPNWLAQESVSAQWLPPRSIDEDANSMPILECG